LKKFGGYFCKITSIGKFLEFQNYFSIENRWNRFTVRRPGPRRSGPRDFIKRWSSAQRSMAQIKNAKGYPLGPISTVDLGVDGSQQLRPTMAAAPWPLLRRGGPGATVNLSRRGLALRGWRGMANSPKGVLGGGVDRSSARDGGRLALIFGNGGSSRWGLSGDKKQSYGFPTTSSSFS
jgi:hypothetical protein